MQETQETRVWSLGWEDLLEKDMATRSSILVWKIPWQRSLLGYSPLGNKESDVTEHSTMASLNGETGTQQSLCAVLSVVMLTFRLGLAMISCWPWWKGITGHVLWTWLWAPSQENHILLHSPLLIPYSVDIHYMCQSNHSSMHQESSSVLAVRQYS